MEAQQLRKPRGQDESATLEFKSEPYWLDHKDDKVKARQRDIDILFSKWKFDMAGDMALDYWCDNKKADDGIRPMYDIGENALTARRI
jgi:hypothetical protein